MINRMIFLQAKLKRMHNLFDVMKEYNVHNCFMPLTKDQQQRGRSIVRCNFGSPCFKRGIALALLSLDGKAPFINDSLTSFMSG